tara:strand:- start:148 stop:327 length:180 start_codon:yes stop_codon:yes gene_type:complete
MTIFINNKKEERRVNSSPLFFIMDKILKILNTITTIGLILIPVFMIILVIIQLIILEVI